MAENRFVDAIEEYLEVRSRTVKPGTLKMDRTFLGRLGAQVGNIRWENVEHRHIEAFFLGDGRRDGLAQQVGNHSFNGARQSVRGFLDFAQHRGYHRRELMHNVRSRRVERRPKMHLSARQLGALLDSCDNVRDRAFLATAMNTGLRGGDVCALRIDQVDLADGSIGLQMQKTDKWDTKPISSDLDRELRSWLSEYTARMGDRHQREGCMGERCQPRQRELPLCPRWYLFPRRDRVLMVGSEATPMADMPLFPAKPIGHPQTIAHRALAAIGLDGKGEGMHTLRRSSGQLYFDQAVADGSDEALLETAVFLNHSDVKVTQVYLDMNRYRDKRDVRLKGRPFITASTTDDRVVDLAARREA